MALPDLGPEGQIVLQQVLGYLNFSSGAPDVQFLANLNTIWGQLGPSGSGPRRSHRGGDACNASGGPAAWRRVGELLREKLAELRQQVPAFADSAQAGTVVDLLIDHVLPGYREFHRDLLFHQDEEILFGPFLVGRTCEAILQQGPDRADAAGLTQRVIQRLNDYIGHRPVATLQSQKIEPYAHEWVRPIPLYIVGAGVAVGRYHDVVQQALNILRETDAELLRQAYFDPTLLDELALDPRAFDFDHPANKRPNYHFGQWDPHQLDQQGRYRRFVVQQVTLDSLLHRVEHPGKLSRGQLLLEASAVLAGTILMASGISGRGPDTHDSNTSLGTLLPGIAAYRDAFYEQLLQRIAGNHGRRLQRETVLRRQPFGGARQHLNAQLTRLRATQVERVQLARIFARMGYPEAAQRQIREVPVASARMSCQIDCSIAAAHQAMDVGRLDEAEGTLDSILEVLRRGIECGAFVDPWNILGFDANFSLFPALENSVHDHRVDELVALIDQIFSLYGRIWSEAAAANDQQLCQRVSEKFVQVTRWWHQFAAHEVSAVHAPSGQAAFEAARNVSEALNLWHRGGAAAGDLAFWAPHAEMFHSPKAYAMVVEALLERGDFVAAMAILVHWLSHASRMPLEHGEISFHRLAATWMRRVLGLEDDGPVRGRPARADDVSARWQLIRKSLDYLEANAEQYWYVPDFGLATPGRVDQPPPSLSAGTESRPSAASTAEEPDEAELSNLYSAAYEDVVYRDSTDDGVEGQMYEPTDGSEEELETEAERIVERLAFIDALARLWRLAALGAPRPSAAGQPADAPASPVDTLRHWARTASDNRQKLLLLLDAVGRFRLPRPFGDTLSMLRYDRQRLVKESLLEQIISTSVRTAEAERFLRAAAACWRPPAEDTGDDPEAAQLDEDDRQAIELFRAALRGDTDDIHRVWPEFMAALRHHPILYVPLAKGGRPRDIVRVRVRQRMIQNLLAWLPRLGRLTQTCDLIECSREMEREVSVGPGAVTEFDGLFETGYRAVVECLVRATELEASAADRPAVRDRHDELDVRLVAALEQLTEALLVSWLSHSRTLRLSVLEKVNGTKDWQQLVRFIETYGGPVFTQTFLSLGNVRAILHQGVDTWLRQLEDHGADQEPWNLLEDLDSRVPRDEAVQMLTLVLEAIVEHYGEYRDYNSTTTQSDRGELLYTLLDFLRLCCAYERVVWNLKPVVLSHEILVRKGRNEAAQLWRRSLSERISEEADRYLKRLQALQKKYAMRMPTVEDRLGERFLRPMVIDRMRALIEPAVRQAHQPAGKHAFDILEEEAALLMREPTGAGLDIPGWLAALDEEVQRVRGPSGEFDEQSELDAFLPPLPLSLDDLQLQLDLWDERGGKKTLAQGHDE